ncbi:cytochrome c [Acetobacter cerevisiae]|uniref:Cytochrome c n=1 Tax=Acetobacter cerevisiae TaxID=178900 RepID=A0ABT1ETU2_9PROT|nr:cytochrome c [Acetobacter cerevisiae]MCP1246597.1 cytochrome c [Acetobacter cerevisiae]MCP1256136.1 cytochrome c [Acetobacter cerevisiae]
MSRFANQRKSKIFSASLLYGLALATILATPVFAAAAPSAPSGADTGSDTSAGASTSTNAQDLITKGRYIAAAADCAACHTVPGSASFAGGYAFQLPIGTLYSSNITPDKTNGIGNWTEAQFVRAIREGVRPDGAALYPAMPFPSYARMTDEDLHALYAYFMHGVQPVAQAVRPNGIPWPLSMRFPLTVWRWVFAPSPDAARQSTERSFPTPELARGAYLVEGPGHCGACHTKRGLAMQETALTAQDGPQYLAGGAAVDGWTPPSLRGDPRTGLGAWSVADLTAFLRTGRNMRGSAFGNMDTAVHHGTQYLTDDDLTAMARYLKALPAANGAEQSWQTDPAATRALRTGGKLTKGQRLYLDNCAACHRSTGAGYAPAFPPLAGNPVVMNAAPDSLIHIVLTGATLHGTQAAPSAFTMPDFGKRLSDAQVAAVVTFIRHAWGNDASAVSDVDVAHLRKRLTPSTMQSAPPTPIDPAPAQPGSAPRAPEQDVSQDTSKPATGPVPTGHLPPEDALHSAPQPAMKAN